MIHRVNDLAPSARGIVESLIGRPLAEGEAFSIRPYPVSRGANGQTSAELERYFAEIDADRAPASEADAQDAIDEAMRSVRPGYASVR